MSLPPVPPRSQQFASDGNAMSRDEVGGNEDGNNNASASSVNGLVRALDDSSAPVGLDSLLFESSPDCVKLLDLAGCLLSMNRNGQCAMEIDDFSKLLDVPWDSLWPVETRHLATAAVAAARSGATGQFTGFCPTAKGAPRWWDVVVTRIPDTFAGAPRILSISRDITAVHLAGEARRLQDQALHDTQVRLRMATDAASLGLWSWEPANDLVRWENDRPYDIFGRDRASGPITAAQFIASYLHPDDLDQFNAATGRSLEQGDAFYFIGRLRPGTGQVKWIEMSGRVRQTASGQQEVLGTVADVTERCNAAEQLREADRRKDEFLAMLAHELRNPLAPIAAAAEILTMEGVSAARVKTTGAVIRRQVRHMTGLIDDLLDVSRVTRGLIGLDKQPHDIARVLAVAAEQSTPLMQARRQRFTLYDNAQRALVTGDHNRLVQVFANLLNNAAKYTPEGGAISVVTEVHAERVAVSVNDNGCGIADDLKGHLFELFSQARRTPDRASGGLGIGLALVRRLVELHDGSVQCSSPGPGQGSTFTVTLPRMAGLAGSAA